MDDSDDDSAWPFEATGADTPRESRFAIWRWILGILVIVLLLCGGTVLALNAWLGHQADKTRARGDQIEGLSVGRQHFRSTFRTSSSPWLPSSRSIFTLNGMVFGPQ
ncbi:hypothetical protein ACQPZJ_34430 [Actinoplanes sp. CA-054009]